MLHQFQASGHGDVTDTKEGDFWMVVHGSRTSQYMLHHLGRETMLAPVTWDENGWPVVNQGEKILKNMEVMRLPEEDYEIRLEDPDSFYGSVLPKVWNYLRNPDLSRYSLTDRKGSLKLAGGDGTLDELCSPAFVGRRQQHLSLIHISWALTGNRQS